jgi:hypothetical protein
MTWNARRLASALTALSLFGAVAVSVVTVAAMATRYISGSEGGRA